METVDDVMEIQGVDGDEELNLESERPVEVLEETETKTEDKHDTDKKDRAPSKDDFDDEELDSDVGENEDNNEEAEAIEKELLNMPPLNSVMADLGNLKQGRRVLVYPLKVNELGHEKMLETISKDTCEEIKLHFVRPKDKPFDWNGFLLMHFSSRNAAKQAVENIKMVRDDLDVKSEEETAYANKVMEQWVRDEKGQKRWTDTLVWVKNVAESVTVEQMLTIFEDAEDIVFRKTFERRKEKEETGVKEAYVVYRNMELAQNAAREFATKDVELEGLKLKIFKYHCPSEMSTRSLLKLKERRLVLKYVDKLAATVERETTEEGFKAPDWCSRRLAISRTLIERDDKARTQSGLPTPSLDELRSMSGIKILRGSDRKETLIKLGVLDRPRRSYRDNRDNNRKRSYDSRNSSGSSKKPMSLLGNPPSLTSMNPIVPPLLLMQQNMGLMGNLMRQQTANMAMMGMANSMMGFGGGSGSGRSDRDRKMLRLDQTGSYHFDQGRSRGSDSKPKGGNGKPISLLDLWSVVLLPWFRSIFMLSYLVIVHWFVSQIRLFSRSVTFHQNLISFGMKETSVWPPG